MIKVGDTVKVIDINMSHWDRDKYDPKDFMYQVGVVESMSPDSDFPVIVKFRNPFLGSVNFYKNELQVFKECHENSNSMSRIGERLIELDKICASSKYSDVEKVKELVYSLYMSGDIDYLYEQSKKAETLEAENLMLYGKLNMIRDLVSE